MLAYVNTLGVLQVYLKCTSVIIIPNSRCQLLCGGSLVHGTGLMERFQIFFDDQHIGGYDDVRALEKENKLQELLK
jgi:hypothetical protein